MIFLFVLALAASPVQEAVTDPLGLAAEGKVQCYSPDTANKTCQSIGAYAADSNGGIINTATLAITAEITMETASPVWIRNGAICGFIRKADVEKAVLRRNGAALAPETAKAIAEKVAEGLAPAFDREICTTYFAEGDHWIARATLDGKPDQLPDMRVVWISPADGYRVTR
jgi:hypothetical protein